MGRKIPRAQKPGTGAKLSEIQTRDSPMPKNWARGCPVLEKRIDQHSNRSNPFFCKAHTRRK